MIESIYKKAVELAEQSEEHRGEAKVRCKVNTYKIVVSLFEISLYVNDRRLLTIGRYRSVPILQYWGNTGTHRSAMNALLSLVGSSYRFRLHYGMLQFAN
jgi:hypothetical protein